MMTGKTFVKAIREDVAKYPNICSMPIHLFDSKDRINSNDDVEYIEDLFANNPYYKKSVVNYLNALEKNVPQYMNIKITENHVILYYRQLTKIKIFSRKERRPIYDD